MKNIDAVPANKPKKSLREIKASYDISRTSTNNVNHWKNADLLSPDAALNPWVRQTTRSRARYEAANNSYAAGVVQTIANDCIGCGPSIRFNTGDKALDRLLDTEWSKWSRAVRLPDKLRQMRMARIVDGEAWGLLQDNYGLRSPIKLDVRLYEADHFDAPLNNVFDETGGIVRDDFGNVLSYNFYKNHPGSATGFSNESEPIPASQCLHWFRATRPGQSRGFPEIAPALTLFAQLRTYTLSVLSSAERASDLTLVYETNIPLGADIKPLDTIDVDRNMGIALPENWKMHQLKAEQPVTGFQEFRDGILKEIGRCLGVPANVILGDSSGYNYSSSRLDHRTYYEGIKVDRDDLYHEVLLPLLTNWWVEVKAVLGLDGMGELPDVMVGWQPPPSIDPLKDANTAIKLVEAGLLTEKEYHASRGMELDTVELQRADELGLTLDEYRQWKRAKILNESIVPVEAPDDEEDT